MDFGKHQDRFGRFSWSKNEKNYLKVQFKVFKKVRTTEKMGRNPDPCLEEYKDYCMNEGECFSHVEENIIGCLCPPLYGGKRCDKFL